MLRVKPIEYVALNTYLYCMKIVCIRQSYVFGTQYRKRILDNCSLKALLLLKIIHLYDPFHYLA
jgi:hypothetical protein